jgi:hypothetical protein
MADKVRRRNYSYFIIKPDGIRFFDRIHDKLSEEFDIVRYFYIEDYKSITDYVYIKHYQEKGEAFKRGYESYLDALTSMYGNHAVLAMVSTLTKNEDFESFKQRVFNTKQELRKELIDPNVAVISNIPSKEPQNTVRVVDEKGTEIKQRLFTKPGHYRINKFDVIHSPDLEEESTRDEIRMLIKSGVIDFKNVIDKKSLRDILRFKTLEGFDNSFFVEREEAEQDEHEAI